MGRWRSRGDGRDQGPPEHPEDPGWVVAEDADEPHDGDDVGSGSRRRGVLGRRRGLIAVCSVGVLAIAGGVAGAVGLGGSSAPVTTAVATASTTVTPCTLVQSSSVPGQVAYGAAPPVILQATGTVTWLPEPGTVVAQGQQVVRVDDRPVVLLIGSVPQFRELRVPAAPVDPASGGTAPASGGTAPAVSKVRSDTPSAAPTPAAEGNAPAGDTAPAPDPAASTTPPPPPPPPPPPLLTGNDVRQLNQNLRDLGFLKGTVTDTFTSATERAVKAWQKSLGEDPTGIVGLGDVVYSPSSLRVVPAAGSQLGQAVAAGLLTTTTQQQVVTGTAPAGAAWAVAGTTVTLTLPGVGDVPGTVATADPVAASDADSGGGTGTGGGGIAVTVTADDPAQLAAAAPGAVTVTHVDQQATDVLCVPVNALVALAEGGYGVQLVQPGPPEYLAVTTGLFADAKVQVSGDGIVAGLEVQVPSDG